MKESIPSQEQPSLATYDEQRRSPSEDERTTVVSLGNTTGMFIAPQHLNVRREGVNGTALHPVPGHGGDVWFVRHDTAQAKGDPEIGAYCVDEIAPIPTDQAEQQ